MPVTYGRPRPAPSNPNLSLEPTPRINSPTSRSPSPVFRQSWKDDLAAIDNGTYDGEVVHEPKSSSLTPLVSLSSLAPTDSQQAEPLPRSSPPSSPAPAYRNPDHTDDPDTSVELNTTLTGPSSDAEDQQMAGSAEDKNDDSDDEPVVKRRSGKPLRVLESDSEEEGNNLADNPAGTSGAGPPPASASSAMSSGNNLSQFSLDRLGMRLSTATTPASVLRKPIKLALSDDEEGDRDEEDSSNQDGVDPIEAASSPDLVRSTRNKGLNKSEKIEMAKTQQKIAGSRDIIIPNASKRIDAKAHFSSYRATLTNQDEIDSYPFPPGAHPRRPGSQRLTATQRSAPVPDPKANLRNKLAMLPLSAHAAPAPRASLATPSDPILGSSQSYASGLGNDVDEDDNEEKGDEEKGMGKPTALGALMFGVLKPKAPVARRGDVFGPNNGSDEELPAASSLFGPQKKNGANTTLSLAEKKRLIAAQQPVQFDSDSDLDLEIASQRKNDKGKTTTARILVRPGQEGQSRSVRKPARDVVTDSQVERAGHAVHFGRDAEQLGSSPVRGGGVYEESQFGRAPIVGSGSATKSRPKPAPKKSAGASNLTLEQLKRHVASRAQLDGQLKQRADEIRWKNSGGRERASREGGVSVEEVVRRAVLGGDAGQQYEDNEDEDEEDEDEDYRGSASESEAEEDKENLPASGRTRKPHEPVSDFDGSGGDEEADADADKENSLELRGIGGRSPAGLNGRSPALLSGGLSPAHLGALSPSRLGGMSPGHLFARSPSHLHPHSRVSSSGSGRLPLSELGDEDAREREGENAAVARAPLGELEVEREGHVQEDDDDEVVRRPAKRARPSISRRLFDEDEEGDEGENAGASRLSSNVAPRRMSPQHFLGSPSERRLGSPTQRLLTPSSRFRSPPSRLRSPLPPTGTQSFTQVETQAMLGGLGDMFGFETQAPSGGNKENGEAEETSAGGGLTQLFAKAEVGTSSAFAALRADASAIELTQDERSKLLYRPVLRDDELRRDQDLFEREDELMAQPFSPTQREKGTQRWLNERGLWTQTRPAQTQIDLPGSTPAPQTRDATSPLASPVGSLPGRRRIVRRGISKEDSPEVKVPSLLDMLRGTQSASNKDKKKKRLRKSEFVEGEAAESDDEYGDFGPRLRKEDEEAEEDDDKHLEELVDDQVMDEDTENAAQVQAKYLEQNAEDDARREKIAREVVAGKTRNRRRGRGDDMDLDDDESEDDGYNGPKKLLKKRKIENDGLEGLEKHESTRAFVATYNKGIKSAEDEEFQHLNKFIDDPVGGAPDLDEEDQSGEEVNEDEEEDREEDVEEQGVATPFRPMQKAAVSSAPVEIAFGLLDESDEEPTFDLPDAATRPSAAVTRPSVTNVARMKTWVAQEGNSRGGPVRSGQGASVTGHNNKNKFAKPKSTTSTRPAAAVASSSSSGMLGRLGKKFSGFE